MPVKVTTSYRHMWPHLRKAPGLLWHDRGRPNRLRQGYGGSAEALRAQAEGLRYPEAPKAAASARARDSSIAPDQTPPCLIDEPTISASASR